MPDFPTWKRKKVLKNWLNAGGALAGGREGGEGLGSGLLVQNFSSRVWATTGTQVGLLGGFVFMPGCPKLSPPSALDFSPPKSCLEIR